MKLLFYIGVWIIVLGLIGLSAGGVAWPNYLAVGLALVVIAVVVMRVKKR